MDSLNNNDDEELAERDTRTNPLHVHPSPPPATANSPTRLEVFCWGGRGVKNSEKTPVHVSALSGIGIKQICCEMDTNINEPKGYVLTESNGLYDWGAVKLFEETDEHHTHRGIVGDALIKEPIVQMDCGERFAAAVNSSGILYVWGSREFWKYERGDIEDTQPKIVKGLAGIRIKQVACGMTFLVALTRGQEVFSWGDNSCGLTGHGKNEGITVMPQKIQAFTEAIIEISAGSLHSAAISASGKLYTWGSPDYGPLGHPEEQADYFVPTRVEALSEKICAQVSCGFYHTCVVDEDGAIYTFGHGSEGQLGLGDTEMKLLPTLVKSLKNVAMVSCGGWHTVALTSDGEVYAWGQGEHNQLGHGSDEMVVSPKLVKALRGYVVMSVAAFEAHTVVLVDSSSCRPTRPLTPMFNDETSADVVIKVDGNDFFARRAILESQSEYFRSLLHFQPQQNEITVKEASKQVFLPVLQHIYGQQVDFVSLSQEHLVELYGLSGLYRLLHLKYDCEEVFKKSLTTSTVLSSFLLVLEAPFDELKSLCIDFIDKAILDLGLEQPEVREILSQHYLTVEKAILQLKKAVNAEPVHEELRAFCFDFLVEHGRDFIFEMKLVLEHLSNELVVDICVQLAGRL